MESFSKFIISHYTRNPSTLKAQFYYSFDEKEKFIEEIDFSPLKGDFWLRNNQDEDIKHILSHIHIALWVSYYKLFPTKEILVKTISLDEKQKNFWNTFYLKWLWEFFYRNELNPNWLANFLSQDWEVKIRDINFNANKSLVLFWWGKDSLVTLELLKQEKEKFDLFSFWKDFPLHELAASNTWEKRLIIKRSLDINQIKKLIENWYYNGHLPITGIISFVSILVWYLYWYKRVITSLEKSADEWNTTYYGFEINHQRSKSSEFENMFNDYVAKYISKWFSSYSPLRQWYEIKIVKEFCKYSQYFKTFSSCNRNFHIEGSKLTEDQLRCGICPKCLFVYTMMRAFLWKEIVNEIFWKDILEDINNVELFKELLWIQWIKPFECVWTNEEMVLAFRLIFNNEPTLDNEIMNLYKMKILSEMTDDEFKKLEGKLL